MKVILIKTFFLLLIPIIIVSQNAEPVEEYQIRMTFDSRLFKYVHSNDAQTALDIWTAELIKKFEDKNQPVGSTRTIVSKVCLTDNMDLVLQDSLEFRHEVINLLAIDYVRYHDSGIWDPVIISASEGHFPEEYLIVVREKEKISDLKSLQGTNLILPMNIGHRISSMWLENLLLSQQKMLPDSFFKNIDKSGKPSKAVLDVFFKKADACVVGYNVFKTMTELNPQIGKELKVIHTSPPFIEGLTCLRHDYYEEAKDGILQVLKALPESTPGRQVLTLFGKSRLISFEDKYILNIKNLVEEHDRLMEDYNEN